MVRPKTFAFVVTLEVSALAIVVTAGLAAASGATPTWNPRAAAAYLDQRQAWWQTWPKAARDHGTVCVSCHTALPYALVRPELRAILHEEHASAEEKLLIDDVTKRVRAWSEVKPFYGDWTPAGTQKAVQSRGTEAVLNALILATRDDRNGVVSDDALKAFANMFALQQTTGEQAGAWPWLNFGLRPWESTTATYFGAALAAIALGREPQAYAHTAEIQPNIDILRTYLRTHTDQPFWSRLVRRGDDPSLFNRAMLLWASARLPMLLSPDERRGIVVALWKAQASDGSWKLASLGHWVPGSGVSPDSAGDGYATGLIAYALEEIGTSPSEPHLARALAWLETHQDVTTGMWRATSLNKRRDPASNVGKFMSDAATAYAVLALARALQSSAN